MALNMRLELKMSQQLVMTPQLQQAIKLLQLSRMDLIAAVRDELLENPMLEEQSEITSSEAQLQSVEDLEKKEREQETKDVAVEQDADQAKE